MAHSWQFILVKKTATKNDVKPCYSVGKAR